MCGSSLGTRPRVRWQRTLPAILPAGLVAGHITHRPRFHLRGKHDPATLDPRNCRISHFLYCGSGPLRRRPGDKGPRVKELGPAPWAPPWDTGYSPQRCALRNTVVGGPHYGGDGPAGDHAVPRPDGDGESGGTVFEAHWPTRLAASRFTGANRRSAAAQRCAGSAGSPSNTFERLGSDEMGVTGQRNDAPRLSSAGYRELSMWVRRRTTSPSQAPWVTTQEPRGANVVATTRAPLGAEDCRDRMQLYHRHSRLGHPGTYVRRIDLQVVDGAIGGDAMPMF